MVETWFGSGSKAVRKLFKSGLKVVQKWFERCSNVVRNVFQNWFALLHNCKNGWKTGLSRVRKYKRLVCGIVGPAQLITVARHPTNHALVTPWLEKQRRLGACNPNCATCSINYTYTAVDWSTSSFATLCHAQCRMTSIKLFS